MQDTGEMEFGTRLQSNIPIDRACLRSTAIGGGLSSIAGASGVGTDASMPQLPHRDSGTRNGKNTDDTALANTSEFCNTIGGKADIEI